MADHSDQAAQAHRTPDPGRQATFGIILLMLVWSTYCMLNPPTPRPDDNADNRPTEIANDNDNAASGGSSADANANANAAGNEPAANSGNADSGNSGSNNAGAGNSATNTNSGNTNSGNTNSGNTNSGGTQPQPGIRPTADGKWMQDPETGEYFPPNYRVNPVTGTPLVATDVAPPNVQTRPDGTPDPQPEPEPEPQTQDDTGVTLPINRVFNPEIDEVPLIGDETFDTGRIIPRFSTRGGSLADLVVKGFPGLSGRDHRTDLGENSHVVRPFVPDHLAFTTEARLPGLRAGSDLARAAWEFLGHRVAPVQAKPAAPEGTPVSGANDGNTDKTPVNEHIVEFRFPPGGGQASGDQPGTGWEVIRRYRWTDTSFEITVELEFHNFTNQPIKLDNWTANGPMGIFTGYRAVTDDYLHYAVDPTSAVKKIDTTIQGNAQESGIDKPIVDITAASFLRSGGYEHCKVWTLRTGVKAPADSKTRDIRWIGQSVDYMMAAFFTPDGENAPRALEGHIFPVDAAAMNPSSAGNGEARGPHRWVFTSYFKMAPLTIPAAGNTTVTFRSYIGPKYPAEMNEAGLQEAVYYSYSSVEWIAEPLLAVMRFFHSLIPNWGIAIILLTLLVRGVLLPVSYWSQLKMQTTMADMKRIQPRLEKLREKFKDDKQKLQQKMIELYREEKVSLGGMFQGCLLMLLQMPIWIALFGAFRYSIDFVGADFLWISDLSKSDALFTIAHLRVPEIPILGDMFANSITPAGVLHFNILPIFVMALMYIQTRMQQKMQSATQTPEQQQQQKIMMGCMFFFFFILFYAMPAGFNLYFLATSAYALVETRYIKRIVQARIDERTNAPKVATKKA